jgi:hypothetical protein
MASALTIQAHAEGTVAGVTQQDTQGPAASGDLLAGVEFSSATTIDLLGDAAARAAQNDAGVAAVLVDGAYTQPGDHRLSAETRWSETATNNRATPVEYLYSFFVLAPKLTIFDRAPLANIAATTEWKIVVRMNGNTIFESSAKLVGGGQSHQLVTTGTSLAPRAFRNASGELFGYEFSRYDNLVSLGFYPPGQGVTVETILTASSRVESPGHGARAEIGDPLKLGSDPGVSGVIIESEPVAVEQRSWGGIKSIYRD